MAVRERTVLGLVGQSACFAVPSLRGLSNRSKDRSLPHELYTQIKSILVPNLSDKRKLRAIHTSPQLHILTDPTKGVIKPICKTKGVRPRRKALLLTGGL